MGALPTRKMKLRINNQQRCRHLDAREIRQLTWQLYLCAERMAVSDCLSGADVALYLRDDEGIRAVKQAVFGMNEITDVVTVSYMPTPVDPVPEVELFVNVQRAFTRACRQGWTPYRELALYIAHGLDHLAGFDDQFPEARRRMRQRELRWISKPDCRGQIERLAAKSCGLPLQ